MSEAARRRGRILSLAHGYAHQRDAACGGRSPLIDAVGDLATLTVRMLDEMQRADAVIAWISVIGAWCSKPA